MNSLDTIKKENLSREISYTKRREWMTLADTTVLYD